MAYLAAEGEPQQAFACVDGTIALAYQKEAGARVGKTLGKAPRYVWNSLMTLHVLAKHWASRVESSAPSSSVCVMRRNE